MLFYELSVLYAEGETTSFHTPPNKSGLACETRHDGADDSYIAGS